MFTSMFIYLFITIYKYVYNYVCVYNIILFIFILWITHHIGIEFYSFVACCNKHHCTQGAQSHKCILLFMSHTLGNILNETGFYKQLQALQIAFD